MNAGWLVIVISLILSLIVDIKIDDQKSFDGWCEANPSYKPLDMIKISKNLLVAWVDLNFYEMWL